MSTVAILTVKLFNWLKFEEFLRDTECWNCKKKIVVYHIKQLKMMLLLLQIAQKRAN